MAIKWEPLRYYFQESGMVTAQFLPLACAITRSLLVLHDSFRIHGRLMFENISIQRSADDDSFKAMFQGIQRDPAETSMDTRFFPYMAPEQTGRLRRRLDHRTDLYSLGVILYELLMGYGPFEVSEPIEWIHAHLATLPKPIIRQDIAPILAAIIIKCLEKLPEQRYQSADGLLADLEAVYHAVLGQVDHYPSALGTTDVPRALRISRKLYARNEEMTALRSFHKMAMNGEHVAVSLVGQAGCGKTALLQNFLDENLAESSRLAVGHAVSSQVSAPFSPISDAFQSLIERLLTGDDHEIEAWKAVFSYFEWPSVFFDILPNFRFLANPTPSISNLRAEDHVNLLVKSFHAFCTLIASAEYPLVIALDDLHYADQVTLDLISRIISNSSLQYVMWVSTWRTEPNPIESIQASSDNAIGSPWVTVYLTPLQEDAVRGMLEDTLGIRGEQVNCLAHLIYERTLGNAFYTRQFVLELIERRYLYFDSEHEQWMILFEEIKNLPATQNVVDLVMLQVNEMPQDTLDLLNWIACMANKTTIDFLQVISGRTDELISRLLTPAVVRGIISVTPQGIVRFVHDQAQCAVYTDMHEKKKEDRHDAIAKALMSLAEDPKARIFQIVYHLDHGHKPFGERIEFARFHLEAGTRARESAAFHTAVTYLTSGYRVLRYHDWDEQHDLMWDLAWNLAYSEYAVYNLKRSDYFLEQTIRHAITIEQLAQAYRMKILMLTHTGKIVEATDMALQGLDRLGLHVKAPSSPLGLLWPFVKLLLRWRFRSPSSIAKLPILQDQRLVLQMKMLHSISPVAVRVSSNLMLLINMTMLEQSLAQGLSADSAVGFCTLGMLLCTILHRFDLGRAYGSLGLRIARRFNEPDVLCSVYFTHAAFIDPWIGRYSNTVKRLQKSKVLACQAGNVIMENSSTTFLILVDWMQGQSLARNYDMLKSYEQTISLHGDYVIINFYKVIVCLNRTMAEDAPISEVWPLLQESDETSRLFTIVAILFVAVLQNLTHDAKRLIMDPLMKNQTRLVTLVTPDFLALKAIHYGRVIHEMTFSERHHTRRFLKHDIQFLEHVVKHAPENHLAKLWIVKACFAIFDNRLTDAIDWFEKAGEEAEFQGFCHYAGLCFEEAARVASMCKRSFASSMYLQRGLHIYANWGAMAKVDQLKKQLDSRTPTAPTGQQLLVVTRTMDQLSRELDLEVVLDVTQSISQEVTLNRLLEKLVKGMVLHAGAQRGAIILVRETGLYVEAESGVKADQIQLYDGTTPLENFSRLPKSIIHFVHRTGQTLVLEDAKVDVRFSNDRYIVSEQVDSVMCLPIMRQGMISGIVYLEHRDLPQIFTQEQLRIVSIIGGQAAVSLENARLYETLESKIRERTDELELSNASLREVNEQLSQSETMRRQMISDISHDLRTPLTSIQGYIEAVLEGVVSDRDVEHFLTIARDRSVQMNHLIQDLLDISKFDEHQGQLHKEMVSLLDLVHAIYHRHEFDIRHAGIQFETLLDPILQAMDVVDWDNVLSDREIFVHVDIRRIDQVFSNLVHNAIRHTQSGGYIRIGAWLCIDEFGELVQDGQTATFVRFDVLDTGVGISPDDLPFIFERFYKVDRSRGKDSSGSGLGLAISRAIVEAHNGRIFATSKLSYGSTFHVVLPIAASIKDDQVYTNDDDTIILLD